MSKYFEIDEINIEENYATISHNILSEQIKVVFDLETFSEKIEHAEGGYVTATNWIDVPIVTIIETFTLNEQIDEWYLNDLNWKSNTYMHQDKIDFISEIEDKLIEMLNY